MFIVACLLLPAVAALLYGMDRVEDWLTRGPQSARRHARTRHLRLIPGGKLDSVPEGKRDGVTRPRTARRHSDAA